MALYLLNSHVLLGIANFHSKNSIRILTSSRRKKNFRRKFRNTCAFRRNIRVRMPNSKDTKKTEEKITSNCSVSNKSLKMNCSSSPFEGTKSKPA